VSRDTASTMPRVGPVSERKSILFVHHRPELGGAPTSLSYLIRELDPEEWDVHIFCPRGPVVELFLETGATVHTGSVAAFTHIWASQYHGRRWLLFARELLRLPKHISDFRRVLREHQYRVVHLNDSPLLAAGWLARRAGVPVVWHLRSALPHGDEGHRTRLMRFALRRLASATVAINDDVAESFGLRSEIVPNSVDLTTFHPRETDEERVALGFGPSNLVVTYFGFLYPSKGFREFIVAARQILDRGIDARFVVVGGAVRGRDFFRTLQGQALRRLGLAREYDREAGTLVEELGLGDRLQFVPFTRDTARYYRATDVVVAPSRGPELGRPVIEAAASGVAVVASGSRSGGGIVVPGVTGVLVHGYEADVIAGAVSELLLDEGKRSALGDAARLHALETFDPTRNARAIEAIYNRLVPRRERIPVLFVHHRPQLGGAPSSLAELIRHLDARFEPHVLAPDGAAAELFESVGARVHRGSVPIFSHGWDNPYKGLRWLVLGRELAALKGHTQQLSALIRKYDFPIVHLNDSPLLASARVAHRHGAKVIWHLRSALAGDGRDSRSRAVLKLMQRWGDAAIAIDEDVAARFHFDLPVTIVHNSVDPPSVPPDTAARKTALGVPSDRLIVGYAGFVRRPKGWPELVRAARILVDWGVPAHFVIMGGGVRSPQYFKTPRGRMLRGVGLLTDEESAIKDLVAELGLDDCFTFIPFTADTREIYAALDVVTFPNQGVGLGRPVLEAAMHGKPVVASGSATGGSVLIPDETGILLDDPTPENIALALKELAENPELCERLGAAAARHARVAFDPERNAREVERVYDEILGLRVQRSELAA
jgi:glycosyltransferase involved in cell wall biosynthesis